MKIYFLKVLSCQILVGSMLFKLFTVMSLKYVFGGATISNFGKIHIFQNIYHNVIEIYF